MGFKADTIYMGDDGRVHCGEHVGVEATYGINNFQPMSRAEVDAMERELADLDYTVKCETCGKAFRRVVLA